MSDDVCRRAQQRDRPCPECPWQRKAPPGKFDADRYRQLAGTARQTMDGVFACHMSAEGGEIACAGYLATTGATSIRVRVWFAAGLVDLHAIDAAAREPDYPDLYGSYAEMAVANGVPADDPALADPDLWVGRGPRGRRDPRLIHLDDDADDMDDEP